VIKAGALKLTALAIVFVVLNVVVVGGQMLWHMGDNKRMDKLDVEMSQLQTKIDAYEAQGEGELDDLEYQNYSNAVDQYNAKVNEYNALADKSAIWYIIPIPGIGGHGHSIKE
jgi:hypothetical protein